VRVCQLFLRTGAFDPSGHDSKAVNPETSQSITNVVLFVIAKTATGEIANPKREGGTGDTRERPGTKSQIGICS